ADVIDNANIQAGNVIIGLASYGKANYETEYNSGIGSNGLTSARHDVFAKYLAQKYPESFDGGIPEHLVYTGNLHLTDTVAQLTLDAGKLVLSPTRTYAPVMIPILKKFRDKLCGIVHCSGGGQTKVLNFASNVHIVKDNLFPTPPLFDLIRQQSQTSWKEMYQVFNMGHRMEIYTHRAFADEIIAIAQSFGVEARIVGYVESAPKTKLSIKTPTGELLIYEGIH
ncbi:MAG: AIR synthase-related protein, partial [Flammeovirgaceae bacterium]|nr:AIR synthase-related protein [Flammeovirgaceae bacterium]MDW8288515.1 AIR synthase-related protein [Flammeovirgaceae bacterium]